MKVQTRLMLVGAVVVTGLAALGGVLAQTFSVVRVGGPVHDQINATKDLVADILPPPLYVLETYATVNRVLVCKTPEATAAAEKDLARLRKDYDTRREFWEKNLTDPTVKQLLLSEADGPAKELFEKVQSEFMPLVMAGKYDEGAALMQSTLEPLYQKHRAAIDKTVEAANTFTATVQKDADATVATRATIALGTGLATLLAVAGALVVFGRSVNRPLKVLNERMGELASGRGDLTMRIGLTNDDELGQLSKSMDRFLDNLQEIVRQVRDSATQVASAATEIAASAEEMSASAGEVARQAAGASESSAQSGKLAQTGGDEVRKTIQMIDRLRSTVSQAAEKVNRLGQASEQIGDIIRVIEDIADQTNLLALNAAIEAARAGEHGRGFSVVADEVRKLAERTIKATEQVSSSIGMIQSETTASAAQINQGAQEALDSVKVAGRAGEGLEKIVTTVQSVSGMIQAIASAAEQAGTGSQHSAAAAAQLSGKAEELQTLVGQFKV